MTTSENKPIEKANGTKRAQFSAVASLRPKRRWKGSASGSVPVATEILPGPITGRGSRAPRLKKSGHAVQLWSSKPMHRELRTADKFRVRWNIHELVGQIRNAVSVAHFSHSH